MELVVDGVPYDDEGQAGLERFYTDVLPSAKSPPTSVAPTPGDWHEAYGRAFVHGDAVLAITVSGTLSASLDSARLGAELALERYPGRSVRILDSGTAAGAQALVAVAAAREASTGADLATVVGRAEAVRSRVRLVAYLDTLEYVWRGGRVPRVAVWASNLFGLKPVMEYVNDKPNLIARPRTRARAMQRLVEDMRKHVGERRTHVAVMHAAAGAEAEELRKRVAGEFDCADIFISQFAPFMGAHTGPGLVGLAYWPE